MLEDEIDGLEVNRDYVARLPILYWQNDYIFSLMFLAINIPNIWKCLTTDVAFYTGFAGVSVFGTLLNFLFSILFIPQINARLPWHNLIAKYRVRKSWLNNPEQIKSRKLVLSDTEIIIKKTQAYFLVGKETKTDFHSWDELRRYFEDKRGFFWIFLVIISFLFLDVFSIVRIK